MFTINLFGTGLRYWICKIPKEEFNALNLIRSESDESFENLLFDLDFINKRGFSHWSKIYPILDECGILISPRNFIEIRKEKKRIQKIDITELTRPFLFDIYNVIRDAREVEIDDAFVNLALVQYNTGLIGKFILEETEIDIDRFQFRLNYEPLRIGLHCEWLTAIYYNQKLLVRQKEDVVVMGNRVLLMETIS